MVNLRTCLFTLLLAASFAGVSTFPANAGGQHCRDEKGKFVKCVPPEKTKQCRDEKGKFIKCPAPKAKAAKHG